MKTICLVTNWYPTKDNPIVGCFFKEQIFAMEKSFNFVVFRYQEKRKRNPFLFRQLSIINKERNSIEYSAVAYIPIVVYFWDLLYNYLSKYLHKGRKVEGVGRYNSGLKRRITRRNIIKLFSKTRFTADAFYCIDGQQEAFYTYCLASKYNKPFIVGEHAPVPWPGTLLCDSNKYAFERANRFLAISNDKIRQLMLLNIKLPQTVYIGNLIDETKFTINRSEKHLIKTFIIVAAHSYYKNYNMFIKVFNRLCEIAQEDFRVLIVGYAANKGYSKNIELFESKIKKSRFVDKTELIPEVPREKMNNIYNMADAFVMTSIQEGQPVSALEASCCGLPVFSTKCGGVEDYIDDENGMIFELTDIEGMARGLKMFIENKIEYDPYIIRRKVVQRFGKKAFCEVFSKAFLETMKKANNMGNDTLFDA